MAPLLRLDRVTAGFGATIVVENISFAIEPAGALVVLGRNGVGKSTLMKTIVGQTRLHSGQICFDNKEIGATPSYIRTRLGVGYVPQTRDIFPSLTVRENLLIAAQPGQWDLERVFALFPNLAERQRNGGLEISGGEQQMLSIGRALMGNPRLLLLDEPMEGLAPVIVEKLFEVFKLLRDTGNLTIILVEQYVNLALAFAPRAIVLDRGRIVYDGRSDELAADAEKMAAYFGASGQGATQDARRSHDDAAR